MNEMITIKELLSSRLHFGWMFLCPLGNENSPIWNSTTFNSLLNQFHHEFYI
jgi:hypothetical protein